MNAASGENPPPEAAALAGLDSDTWALLLPHARAALHELPDDAVDPGVERLRSASTGQLAGGPRRAELCRLIARGGPVWEGLRVRLMATASLPDPLRALVEDPMAADAPAQERPTGRGEEPRLRERLREARDERDSWRRRAEGERARAEALARRLTDAEAERDRTQRAVEELRGQLAAAEEERARAVEREARRRDAEVRTLRDQITALRRAEEDREARRRRESAERERAARALQEAARAERQVRSDRPSRVVPGRPTELPHNVAAGTTEAARLLLHRGRLVVVDGYNVTLRHRGHLDLETQRSWLVQLLATLASRRGIRPVVVFDGEREGGGRPPRGRREVEVRFTPAGITADDEIVLTVEATDEPLVVVTDDRDLVARVTLGRADVISTTQLLGVAS